jgi:hypothetical protein
MTRLSLWKDRERLSIQGPGLPTSTMPEGAILELASDIQRKTKAGQGE